MQKEIDLLQNYLKTQKQNVTPQRLEILTAFLNTESHVTADELYEIIRQKNRKVGRATVYRSLKIFKECGLAREVHFEDGYIRYEHLYNHRHHDHLICLKCGLSVEFFNPAIEDLQAQIAQDYDFQMVDHHQDIFGYCTACRQDLKIGKKNVE